MQRYSGLLIPLFAMVAMLLIGYGLLAAAPMNPPTLSAQEAGLLPTLVAIAPEPRDKFMYGGLLLTLPLVLLGCAYAARRIHATPLPIPAPRMPVRMERFAFIAISGGAALILIGLRLWTTHSLEYNSTFTSHYEAVTFAVVRIAAGGTCLANVIPQYGCMGEYLRPILAVLGTSTLAVSGLFLLLQLSAVAAVFLFTRRVITTPAWQIAALLGLCVPIVLNLSPTTNDPILQYYPGRFFFPALSLLVMCWLQRDMRCMRASVAGIFAGMAVTWNLESGIAVLIALGLFTLLGDTRLWSDKRLILPALTRSLCYGISAIAWICLFALYLTVKSGGTTEFFAYFAFQITFYLTGFGMISMPAFPSYWSLHAALIIASLACVAIHVGARHARDLTLERIAYLAILAAGLTLYYTGRSHPLVLKLVSWPDIILAVFLLERATCRLRRPFPLVIAWAAAGLCTLYLLSFAPAVAKLMIAPRWGTPNEVQQDIAYIAEHTTPGESISIFALNQGSLHGNTATIPAIRGVGMAEMIRVIDLEKAQQDMIEHGPEKLFLGTNLAHAAEMGKLGTNLILDMPALRQKYALAGWGPGARLMYLRRKPYNGEDLFTRAAPGVSKAQFSARFDPVTGGLWGRPTAAGMNIPDAALDESFTIRMRFTPAADEPGDGYLFSNYCCSAQGLALKRIPGTEDQYGVLLGDGKAFWSSPTFALSPGTSSTLTLTYDDGHLRIWVNETSVLDEKGLGPIAVSPMPITIGGWYGPGGLFAGHIDAFDFFAEAQR